MSVLVHAAGPAKAQRDDLLAKRDGLRQQQLAAEGQLESRLRCVCLHKPLVIMYMLVLPCGILDDLLASMPCLFLCLAQEAVHMGRGLTGGPRLDLFTYEQHVLQGFSRETRLTCLRGCPQRRCYAHLSWLCKRVAWLTA